MTASSDPEDDGKRAVDHLEDLADGCGCAEIWEHLAKRRNEE
jgi:hypothetical protein